MVASGARRDEGQCKCNNNKVQKGVAGKVNDLLKDQVANTVIAMPSLMFQALTQANRDCKIRTVTGRARQDKGQGKCTDNKEQKGVAGKVNELLKNRVANTVIAMPSLTSQALTQANRDCNIRTVTGRARRDKGQGKCADNKEQKGVAGRVTNQLTNLIAVAVIAMPSLTS